MALDREVRCFMWRGSGWGNGARNTHAASACCERRDEGARGRMNAATRPHPGHHAGLTTVARKPVRRTVKAASIRKRVRQLRAFRASARR